MSTKGFFTIRIVFGDLEILGIQTDPFGTNTLNAFFRNRLFQNDTKDYAGCTYPIHLKFLVKFLYRFFYVWN